MSKKTEKVIVSACLLGIPSRYDGGHSKNDELIRKLSGKVVIAVCPEELGRLATPRPAAEIKGSGDGGCDTQIGTADGASVLDGIARVIDIDGTDVTSNFIKGAEETLRIAMNNQVTRAYLKEKSPSCGVNIIKQKGSDTTGIGVLTALLKKNNIETIGVT